MGKIRIRAKTYKRGSWVDRFGHRHKGATVHRKGYLTKDRGKPGRTPKSKRWYNPQEPLNWHKDMPTKERREAALESRKGDALSTARGLLSLSNVSTDVQTKRLARADADYFFALHRKTGE